MALLELDDFFLKDDRFRILGELSGSGYHDVRSRVISLWDACIRTTTEIQTGEQIDILTGWMGGGRKDFGLLMAQAMLADLVPGGFRIRGVRDKMQWLIEKREKEHERNVEGGKARAAKAKRDGSGKYKKGPAGVQPKPAAPSHRLDENQPQPASPSHSPLSTSPMTLARHRAGAVAARFSFLARKWDRNPLLGEISRNPPESRTRPIKPGPHTVPLTPSAGVPGSPRCPSRDRPRAASRPS
jgi:hypothetical protein